MTTEALMVHLTAAVDRAVERVAVAWTLHEDPSDAIAELVEAHQDWELAR